MAHRNADREIPGIVGFTMLWSAVNLSFTFIDQKYWWVATLGDNIVGLFPSWFGLYRTVGDQDINMKLIDSLKVNP